jgi:predicted GTPase
MGPTGVGKSTVRLFLIHIRFLFCFSWLAQFIETATGQDGQTIGHGLRSFTDTIRTVRVTHPMDGKPVILVDTPGFGDTAKSDTKILAMIADWLVRV